MHSITTAHKTCVPFIRFRLLLCKSTVRQGKTTTFAPIVALQKNDYLCCEMGVPISPMRFLRGLFYASFEVGAKFQKVFHIIKIFA